MAIIKQMSRQVWRDSAGEYQADEPAVVARLSWRPVKSTTTIVGGKKEKKKKRKNVKNPKESTE